MPGFTSRSWCSAQPAEGRAPLQAGVDLLDHVVDPRGVHPGGGEHRREVVGVVHADLVEPLGDRVLQVALLQRGEVRPRLHRPLDGRLLALDQPGDELGGQPAVGEQAQLVPHRAHPAAQLLGGPHRGGRRVVQLVGEVGRQVPELHQVLALAHRRLGGPHALVQPVQQVHRHRALLGDQGGEVLGGQPQEPAGPGGAQGGLVVLRVAGRVGPGRAGVGAAVRRLVDQHVLAVGVLGQPQAAVEQHVQRVGRVALGEDDGVAVEHPDLGVVGDPLQVLVAQRLEQEQRAQLVQADLRGGCGHPMASR
jgi:hypothetical protein